ncbi:GNAT family N-acetyltransferase [Fulvivirga sp. M361]|uniref:GNAT family N-acetyltransferase n=1 Tax=Fulvivirga sp. M361 TaxID=2594266 RepID=UPI00117B497F|nr:GNAT family N-acetyltransferase [Fulvivirga sp. M361]TRX61275.1 GNAT family N-acetyltransferase [Fulvivirga sp. M361]
MIIRRGTKEDLPQVLSLIKELAQYEKAADQVSNTVQMMEEDGFGEVPVFGFFVAVEEHKGIVGIALYYYRYSTWKGKRIYLEDLVVTENERGRGTGKKLFDAIIDQGKSTGCTGMMWQVLDWNEPAINFYKKYYQATLDDEWVNCSIDW